MNRTAEAQDFRVLPPRVSQIVPSSPPAQTKAQGKLLGIRRPGLKLPDVLPDLSVVVDTDTTAVVNAYYREMRSTFEHLRNCDGPDYKRNHRPSSTSESCSIKFNTFTICLMAAYTAATLHA
jgi:hypothetical protein